MSEVIKNPTVLHQLLILPPYEPSSCAQRTGGGRKKTQWLLNAENPEATKLYKENIKNCTRNSAQMRTMRLHSCYYLM